MNSGMRRWIVPILVLAAELLIGFLWLKPLAYHQTISYSSEDLFTDTDRYGDDGLLGGVLQPGFYVDNSIGACVATPAFPAGRGVYRITVRFDSNGPSWSHPRQTVSRVVAADDANDRGLARLVESEQPFLSGADATVTYRADITAADEYRVLCQIDPGIDGQYVLVREITVLRMTGDSVLRDLSGLLLLFTLIDLLLWLQIRRKEAFSAWRREHGLVVMLLAGIVCFACFPMLEQGFYFGDDLYYHMRRILYLAEGIRSGVFPVKIQAWGHGYGYAVGVGYGDLLLLPSALLYLLGYSLTACLKGYILLMTVCTAAFSYLTCRNIAGSRLAGITGSVVCTLIGYRLSMAYSGSMFGEFGAYSFLPLVILGMWGILRTGAEREDRRKSENILAFALAAIIGSHVISTLITGVMILLLCLLWIRRTLDREVLPSLFRAAGKALALSLWFLVPLADYLLTMDLDVSRGFVMWRYGLRPTELFLTLPDAAEVAGGFAYLGFASLIILAVTAGLLFCGLAERQGRFRTSDGWKVLILEAFCLWFSTKLFPLHSFAQKLPALYHAVETIQFSWRVLNYASVFLAILAAVSVQILTDAPSAASGEGHSAVPITPASGVLLASVLITVTVLQSGEYLQDVVRDGRVVHQLGEYRLDDPYHAEFSLKGESGTLSDTTPGLETAEGVLAELIRRNGTTVRAQIANPTDRPQEVRFPLWAYRGYRAYGRDGSAGGRERLPLSSAVDRRVAVTIPAGFSGEVTVRFCEPWFWRLSEIVSVLMLLYLCLGGKLTETVKRIGDKKQVNKGDEA